MSQTLAGLVRDLAAARPDAPAVTLGEATRTFAELDARSSRVARALQAAGVGAGDRVGVLDKNAPTFFEVVFGAAKLGAVTVGLNFRLAAPEIADVVADAAPRVVVVDPEFAGLLPEGGPQVVRLGPEYEAWLAEVDDPADPGGGEDPDAVVLQLYSSGTTGRPKGAMLTSANLLWTPRMGREFYGMDAGTVNLVPSPLFHIGGAGYSLTALGQGGHTVLVRDMDPVAVLGLIERHRVTHNLPGAGRGADAGREPGAAGTDLSSLRRIAYGAAPMGRRSCSRRSRSSAATSWASTG